ncbi:hypothetical protein GCM10010168_32060 [Actinoplanes ianthinogenes]|uniref:Uncharacterized protein n=1 Tax=Actinoplanes ianthinogenes TaxID=122358 RepID=A0ABM7LM46_9ACTN|nr:hypothetical protein [Actinoplanes ianthinogenes]BCJ40347.1 hypothetical protein Aiant_10040 [Actinoplanes ianthinogenes]GGR11612.1 hypothetical protein GCM10010168_32060 [Actinoplanes ianthinogenes]
MLALVAAVAALPVADAAYTATTSTPVNTFTAGTVALSAAAPAGKVFSVANAIPGSYGASCVITTYTGTAPATVRLYFTGVSGTLGNYLVARVQSGTGTQTDCSDFTSPTTLYNASAPAAGGPTLAAYLAAHTGWATGDGAWPVTGPATRAWKFEYLLIGDDNAQNSTLSFTAVWEAQT